MKRILITIQTITFLILTAGGFAQTSVYLGPLVGYQTHAIINQNNYGQRGMDYVYNGDLMYGASFGVDFGNKHLVQLDITIAPAGQIYNDTYDNFTLDKEVNLSYLQVPLTYRFVTGRGDKTANKGTNFHILAGIYMGFLQDVEMSHQIDGNSATLYDFVTHEIDNRNILGLDRRMPNQMDPDFNDLFTEQDFGAILGFGVQSFLKPQLKLVVEVRAGISLQDINAEQWRFLNRSGGYNASRNLFANGSLGVQYYFK